MLKTKLKRSKSWGIPLTVFIWGKCKFYCNGLKLKQLKKQKNTRNTKNFTPWKLQVPEPMDVTETPTLTKVNVPWELQLPEPMDIDKKSVRFKKKNK